jgi:hypothetical protein
MKIVNAESEPKLKLMLYGVPGSTKTRTAASAALDDRTAPALLLDMGGNPLSIRDYAKKPTIIQIDSLNDITTVYDWLVKGQPADHALAKAGLEPGYKTVIIDSITDVQRYAFAMLTGSTGARPGEQQAAVQIQHHNVVLGQMTTISRDFFRLPLHVIITALEHEKQDSIGNLYYRPMLTGQAEGAVGAYAYAIGRCMHKGRIDTKFARLLEDAKLTPKTSIVFFNPSTRAVAKDQHNFGAAYIVDPTVTKLLDAMDATTYKG